MKKRILFVCHGNICRSPMAEYVMRHLVRQRGLAEGFLICSAATSTEEIGNGVHSGTRRKLAQQGIPCGNHHAVQMTCPDADRFDLLIGMDSANLRNMTRIAGEAGQGKLYRLLDFTAHPRDIADPWYTGNFDETFSDVLEGCTALLSRLLADSTMSSQL